MTKKVTKFRGKFSQSFPRNASWARLVMANQIKGEFETHFWCFVKFVGGPEQGFWRCIAGVISRGLDYVCNACYMIIGRLSFLFKQQNYIFIAFFLISYNEFKIKWTIQLCPQKMCMPCQLSHAMTTVACHDNCHWSSAVIPKDYFPLPPLPTVTNIHNRYPYRRC